MAYPALFQRLFNYLRDKNNGLESPDAAKLDIELDAIQVSLAMIRDRVKGITTADGRLRNVPVATAAALVGTQAITGDGTQVLTTTIPWQPAFSVNSVLVMVSGQLQRPAQIQSVADVGGFLVVTMQVANPLGALCVVWALEPGAGVLVKLASTLTGNGASLLGLEDALGQIDATNVEDALAEIFSEFEAFVTAVGTLADYFTRDGLVVATGDFDMGGFKVTNAADGVDEGDYVTIRQVATYIAAWNDLQRFYLKRDGTTAMAGPMNFGNNKGINLADPDLEEPLDAVNVRSMLRTIATSGAAPVGIVLDYVGENPPANWLICDGQAYKGDAYPVLYGLLDGDYREGTAQGCQIATFPNLIAANITAGAITTLPTMTNFGRGYTGIPVIEVHNPDGTLPPTPPTFTVVVTLPVDLDGPTVLSGGELTITLASGGVGVLADASIVVVDALAATPGAPALAQLPSGYFKVPDLRGRVSLGAGTESKTPGIVDPPDVTKGDDYTATLHAVGEYGGEEKHTLTTTELARHRHQHYIGLFGSSNESIPNNEAGGGTKVTSKYTQYTGDDTPHNTLPPYHVLNKIIKAA